MAAILKKKRYKILFSLLVLILLFCAWFIYRVKLTEPKITNIAQYENLKVTVLHDSLRICGQNWLKKNKYGLYELYVEGDDYERGYVNGLLTKDLMEKQEIAFKEQIDELIPSSFYQSFLKYMIAWFNRDMDKHIPQAYKDEIYGVSKSFSDKYTYLGPAYQRILNYHGAHDIGHMMQNMNFVGCTSFGLWNSATQDSSLLLGRNFDFYVGDKFAEDKIIFFVNPKQGHKFMMVTWGGMVGVTSGMNAEGLSITLNSAKSTIPTGSATPVSIIARDILQHASTIAEAYQIAQKYQSFVSESFMIGSAKDRRAAIIEKSTTKTALYESSFNDKILCTNHFQASVFEHDSTNIQGREQGASKYRYERLLELLPDNNKFAAPSIATVLRDQSGKGGANIGLGNESALNQLIAHHSVIFSPEKRVVWVSSNPFQLGTYVAYDLNKVFANPKDYTHKVTFEPQLLIAPDSMLYSSNFVEFQYYRKTTKVLTTSKFEKELSAAELQRYESANPEYYETHYLLGQYYLKHGQKELALAQLQKALSKQLPKIGFKTEIEEMIREHKEKK